MTYVKHHKQKIVLIFAARCGTSPKICAPKGWQVDYVRLDDASEHRSFTGEVARACERPYPLPKCA